METSAQSWRREGASERTKPIEKIRHGRFIFAPLSSFTSTPPNMPDLMLPRQPRHLYSYHIPERVKDAERKVQCEGTSRTTRLGRLEHSFKDTCDTYHSNARNRGGNITFDRPGAVPDSPHGGLSAVRRADFGIRAVTSGLLLPPYDERLAYCRLHPPVSHTTSTTGPSKRSRHGIIRPTESHPRHRQRVPFRLSPHRSVIVFDVDAALRN